MPAANKRGASASGNILIVEPDSRLRTALEKSFSALSLDVHAAGSAREAISALGKRAPHLVILDLDLPDSDGTHVLAEIRRTSEAPVIVHSARSDESDKVAVLDAGADDYLVKPVGEAELMARARAHLRRRTPVRGVVAELGEIRVGPVSINVARQRVVRDGIEISLTPTEWSLLKAMASRPGQTFTYEELWRAVWNRQFGDARVHLRVHVTHLRQKIEMDAARPALLLNVPGVGYLLKTA
jgi:two-component system KDP operon response regulator KdpE